MIDKLKLSTGTTQVPENDKNRNGKGREVWWDGTVHKLRFKAGGARRMRDAITAERWAKERGFKLVVRE